MVTASAASSMPMTRTMTLTPAMPTSEMDRSGRQQDEELYHQHRGEHTDGAQLSDQVHSAIVVSTTTTSIAPGPAILGMASG
jgi:hypothetical protein